MQKGGLVISHYKEFRDKLIDLASKIHSPAAIPDETKIQNCCNSEVKSYKENKESSVKRLSCNNHNEDHGVISICGLWGRTDCILDVRVTNVNAKSNGSKTLHKVLVAHEREKKKKIPQGVP